MTDEQYGEKLPDKKTVNQLWQDLKAAWEPLKGVAFSGTEVQIKARKNINDIQSKMRDMGIKSRGQLIEVTDWDKPREEREKSPTQQLREEIDELRKQFESFVEGQRMTNNTLLENLRHLEGQDN